MDREREDLLCLTALFEESPVGERTSRALDNRAFHSLVFCEWLIETSRELARCEAVRAEEQARLAVEIADRLEPVHYPGETD